MDLHVALEVLSGMPPSLAYAALFGGAFVEYVFPPFPGDTVVVAGVALVVGFGWALPPVFAAVTLGAAVGGWVGFTAGRWAARAGAVESMGPKKRTAVLSLVARFERWGTVYLAINRFLPGIRALFFVAAGLAGLRTAPVIFWALVSATAWNALLIGLGVAVGGSVETLALWAGRHSLWVGVVVTVVAVILAVRTWREVASVSSSS